LVSMKPVLESSSVAAKEINIIFEEIKKIQQKQ